MIEGRIAMARIDTSGASAPEPCARACGDFLGTSPWSGTVVSAHGGAINILRADGLLVSVVAEERSMTALSILAGAAGPLPDGEDARALAGRPAEFRCGRLLISGRAPIGLWQGRTWTGSVGCMGERITAAKALLLEGAMAGHGKPGGLLGLLVAEAAKDRYVHLARNALAEGTLEALVGLGPGMTPAGDDFLAGVLLAGTVSARAGAPGVDAARIERALPETTPAGRTLLWLALRGSVPAYLCAFIAGLAAAESAEAVGEAARAACSHGATSGTDALAGFCVAMRPPAVGAPYSRGLYG
jgi:hypothetical protein